jgi:hypothetical protein
MSDTGKVLLVGSIARPNDDWTIEDVFRRTAQRIEIARRHLADFGIATACGWGRRPLSEKIADIIALNRDVAEAAFGA